MNAALGNVAIMLGANQLVKRIPFDDHPEYVQYARVAYVSAQLLCLAIFYFCSVRIKRANDLTVLKYVEPKNPMSQEPGELVTTTHRDYDLADVRKAMRGIIMGTVMVAVMHGYFKYTNPLVIQSILPLKNALESKQAQLWIWGQPATGDLKRPFKAPNSLFGGAAAPAAQSSASSSTPAPAAAITEKKKSS
ncbi:phosphate transporter (Pho88) [Tilletia horrida]|uniref:Phosphate transporter (Pho88) n=1 Tax=Tilletia horrida TaxID=155126 RepID=A0AAN6GJP9_9BASI|nr:phosphate transporter (Pho88) [Tilletia horrida]KAK0537682.1 phosphate transporter (Pho88) [Tilletia horrida]KAK0538266.1 phosphate transporter (Pho88) [Tilletia horrida]KAK0566051.1 phosphate transporter (Pho88) [Tilletia horrida]